VPRPAPALGQRDLFTRRVRKPPPAPEFALQCMVADILNRWITPGWRFSHFPAGELRNKITAARLKRMGLARGWADLILLSPAALVHFLELKRRGETLSDDQEDFEGYCLAHGYPHAWTDRFDDALVILKRWGALRTGISA
jgi:hypothetical protein